MSDGTGVGPGPGPAPAPAPPTPGAGEGPGTTGAAASGAVGAWQDGWTMAMGTLTAVPTPPPSRIDRDVAGRAMALAPVAALVPGGAAALVGLVATVLHVQPLVAAALAVTAAVLANRAFHLDGLADTVDGLAASYDRQKALRIMRTGDSGPAGVCALVLVLAVQVAATAQLLGRPGPWGVGGAVAVACGFSLGRLALVLLCREGVPAARPDGLGVVVAQSVPTTRALGVTAAAVAGHAVLVGCATGDVLTGVLGPVLAVALLVPLVLALVHRVVARLGGISGDVLGAGVEIATAAALVVLAAVVAPA